MRDVVIVEAVRTPVGKGKPGGAYADVHPVDLHAHAIRNAVERLPGLDPAEIDDVIGGVVGQVGEQSGNSTRYAALAWPLPRAAGRVRPGASVAAAAELAPDVTLLIDNAGIAGGGSLLGPSLNAARAEMETNFSAP
jgi:acetyl-CoA acyltransferase